MPQSINAPSCYQVTAAPSAGHPRLSGEVRADVCVIGAGYTGLSAALELASAGYKVVVLEAGTVGYGASGRNGGQICTGFSSGQQKIEAQLGREDARRCFALAEESKQLLKDRIARKHRSPRFRLPAPPLYSRRSPVPVPQKARYSPPR